MAYERLDKLFYKERSEYQNIYLSRYNSECAYRLDFSIGDSPAFLLITPDILDLVASIYKNDKELTLARIGLPGVAVGQFRRSSLVDEIYLSNDMEGVRSTRREIEENLAPKGKRNRFHGIVQKYFMLTEEEVPLKIPEDIRSIYNDLVLAEVQSEHPENKPDGRIFRAGSVSVTSKTQKEIHRGLYPEDKIISSMDAALNILNDEEIPVILRVAVFHYFFGYIHPFYDGNGRTSRFISSYLLSRELDELVGYRLSYTIKNNSNEYYKAFEVCNDPKSKGDLTPFVYMFLKMVNLTIIDLRKALKKREELLVYYEAQCDSLLAVPEKYKGLYSVLIQASLFSSNGITLKELCGAMKKSESTLRSWMKTIKPDNLLKSEKQQGTNYFRLDLDVIDEMADTSNE